MVDQAITTRIDAAVALQQVGKTSQARRRYLTLLPLVQSDAGASFFIGCRLLELKRYDDALVAFNQAVTVEPRHASAHNNIGTALMGKQDLQAGAAAFQRALDINSDYADAKRNLANVYSYVGRQQEQADALEPAVTLYERSLKLRPDHFQTVLRAGAVHLNLGNEERAFELLSQAVSQEPEDRAARRSLIDMLEKAGRLSEASMAITAARDRLGQDAAFDLTEAKILSRENDLPGALKVMEAADLSDASITVKTNIFMDMGQTLDRLDRGDEAMTAFAKGNSFAAERLAAGRYTKQQFTDQVRDMRRFVAEGDFSSWPNDVLENDEPVPVFMIGFPRSGTTLLDNMLDAHPSCRVLEEKATIIAVHAAIIAAGEQYPDRLRDMMPTEIEGYRRQYWETVRKFINLEDDELLVDKLPLNIIRVPLIKRILPNAKFILSVRHPCDCVLSCYMQSFAMNAAMANFLTLEDAANLYRDMMSLWQACETSLSLDVHQVRYEDLTNDFEKELRAVVAFLGLKWDDAILEYRQRIEEKGLVTTPSYHQIGEPIYDRATARWERYREYLEPQMPTLEPFLLNFGYSA